MVSHSRDFYISPYLNSDTPESFGDSLGRQYGIYTETIDIRGCQVRIPLVSEFTPLFNALKSDNSRFANKEDAKWLQEFAVCISNLIEDKTLSTKKLESLLSAQPRFAVIGEALYTAQTMFRVKMNKFPASPDLKTFKEFVADVAEGKINNHLARTIPEEKARIISNNFNDQIIQNYCTSFAGKVKNNETFYDLNPLTDPNKFADYVINEVRVRPKNPHQEKINRENELAKDKQNSVAAGIG